MTSGSVSQRIERLVGSPGGRGLMRRGRRRPGSPGTQRTLQQLMARLTGWSSRRR